MMASGSQRKELRLRNIVFASFARCHATGTGCLMLIALDVSGLADGAFIQGLAVIATSTFRMAPLKRHCT
jgi:hypothetical protein